MKGLTMPRGIGCGPIAEDAGLWNIAWLTLEKQFVDYEKDVHQEVLPMWTARGVDFITQVGSVVVDGERFKSWAARHPANELLAILSEHPPTGLYPAKNSSWSAWSAFANYRARTSADCLVTDLEFAPAKSYSALRKEADHSSLVARQLPRPVLPVFLTAEAGTSVDFVDWLGSIKSGTIH